MLVHDTAAEVTADDYPDQWREGELVLPLSYQFEPGQAADGVTVDVPVATLNQVDPTAFTWQVPGLRAELVIALIRSLPKQLRVNFVPGAQRGQGVPGGRPRRARRRCWTRWNASCADATASSCRGTPGTATKVPDHLRPTFRVLDERGRVVGVGQGPGDAEGAAAAEVRGGDGGGGGLRPGST